MKTYRGFLFDADNTIFDYDRAETEALTETLSEVPPRCAAPESAFRVPRDQCRLLAEVRAGGHHPRRPEGCPVLVAPRGARRPRKIPPPSRRATSRISPAGHTSSRRPGRSCWRCPARACSGLVTNGISLVQRGRIEKAGIAHLFRAVLISEELGVAKPDPRFFQAAIDALSLAPEDLLCVGDNPAADIEGARSAGIDACWYAPAGQPWPGPGGAADPCHPRPGRPRAVRRANVHTKCILVYFYRHRKNE